MRRAPWAITQLSFSSVLATFLTSLPSGIPTFLAACAVNRRNPDRGMRSIVGYMAALLIGTIIIAAMPWISTVIL